MPIECVGQEMDNWCWAACVEMTLAHFGKSAEQEDIVSSALGLDCTGENPDPGCDVTLSLAGSADGRDIVSVLSGREVPAEFDNVVPGPAKLATRLQSGPVIALLNGFGGADGHVVLIVGSEPTDDADDPMLTVNDPKSDPPRTIPVSYMALRAGSFPGLGGWTQTVFTGQEI